MNQRQIKLPFTCKQLWHSLGISWSISITAISIYYANYFSIVLAIFYPLFLIIDNVTTKALNNKPILPFKFICKCEDESNA